MSPGPLELLVIGFEGATSGAESPTPPKPPRPEAQSVPSAGFLSEEEFATQKAHVLGT
jgi:hypothetical protein